ncbi:single-stranded-DNA-specific exonuclease RecJ [Roseitranquillus sediminis]|uniref:single-stranded-DNA-specific exonuclease RecJ n=1 Tax=Roseitranquillus sediminis TaxID=2809051 RepID=UPI001D0C5E5E|nr:single-stranded-DNA-specific exonuclease RecJ [Roseitranquillus sediminis]MBM9593133.1 single-stranded-DNA-specific exonuclease RecJ [Roseitranquillus sediminis]
MPRDHASTAFLNVEASVTGRRWVGPTIEADRLTEAMAQATGLPEVVCRCLVARGVAPDGAAAYLAPTLRDLLPDPRSLRDMEVASQRLLRAVRRRERVAIFADYDVDGGASAALLLIWLRHMGLGATLYVPDRLEEGYGPNEPAMAALAAEHDLIVCVDCGTVAHGPVAAARGADVVVLDHHLGGAELPAALAVVNPNRADEDGSLAHLCAAAVVFLLLVDMGRRLREEGANGPDLIAMLDLVALATVADVAPLVGVNRALVRRGLEVMRRRERPGLVALADVAALDRPPECHHLGFVLGPRINAGGRIGRADLGARVLSTDDPHEAAALAEQLHRLNDERREIEAQVREAALAQVEARGDDGPLAWAAGEGWHPGVVGIVAARLKEATGRPAVVIGFDGATGVGSGRSVAGVDLGAAVHRLAAEGLLLRGGGHRMAAGLSVERNGLEPAMARLGELLARQAGQEMRRNDLVLDALVAPCAATAELVRRVDAAGPFGMGSSAPRFALADVRLAGVRRVGEGHLRLDLADGAGGRLQAIAFRAFDGPLGPAVEARAGRSLHLAGRLEINVWQGRERVQLRVEDAACD